MITLLNINIESYSQDYLTLTWEYENSSESLSNYQLSIYRSESPGTSGLFDYELIQSGISASNYLYTDTSISGMYGSNRTWFYKFEVENIITSGISIQPDSPIYWKYAPLNKQTKEIIRRKQLVLNKKVGRDFQVLKKIDWGTRCTECWDELSQRVKYSDCTSCYGTGWISGYYAPIRFKATMTSAPTTNQIRDFGEWQPSNSLLYMMGYPPIKPRDVLVDDTNKRWIVIAVNKLEMLGVVIEQSIQLALLPPSEEVYKIIVPKITDPQWIAGDNIWVFDGFYWDFTN